MGKWNELVKWFLYITPGIVFVYAVNVQIAGDKTVPAGSLWHILLAGFLTALATTFLGPGEWDKNRSILAGGLLHYAVLSVIMIGCGCLLGWMELNTEGILMMLASVAMVYLLTCLVYYLIDVKQANEINQKLKEKYGDKE